MPTYDYACPACGGFEAFRTLAQRNDAAACPGCATPSPRVIVSAPRLSCVAGDTRRAMDRNEQAAHAPVSSRDADGYARLRHPAGCGCCSATKRATTVRSPSGAKTFPTKRPWMISH